MDAMQLKFLVVLMQALYHVNVVHYYY